MFDPEMLFALVNIILADLLLSGDNAVVIGMAARGLSPPNRRRAVIFGGAGAVGLRILFTAMAALLLDIPYLQAAGGLLLFWVAYRLLRPHDAEAAVSEADSLGQAIRTIVLADVVMSLDNILAVAASAHGHVGLLLFGLALSIPILLFGSDLVARLLGQYPILVYVGAVVLIFAAVRMVVEDRVVTEFHHASWLEVALVTIAASAITIALARRAARGEAHSAPPTGVPPEVGGTPRPTSADVRTIGAEAGPAGEAHAMNPTSEARRRSR